jgi:hypothetical protein
MAFRNPCQVFRNPFEPVGYLTNQTRRQAAADAARR